MQLCKWYRLCHGEGAARPALLSACIRSPPPLPSPPSLFLPFSPSPLPDCGLPASLCFVLWAGCPWSQVPVPPGHRPSRPALLLSPSEKAPRKVPRPGRCHLLLGTARGQAVRQPHRNHRAKEWLIVQSSTIDNSQQGAQPDGVGADAGVADLAVPHASPVRGAVPQRHHARPASEGLCRGGCGHRPPGSAGEGAGTGSSVRHRGQGPYREAASPEVKNGRSLAAAGAVGRAQRPVLSSAPWERFTQTAASRTTLKTT